MRVLFGATEGASAGCCQRGCARRCGVIRCLCVVRTIFCRPCGVEVLLSEDLGAAVANAVPVMLLGDSSATVFVACDVAAELGNVACVVDPFPFGDG